MGFLRRLFEWIKPADEAAEMMRQSLAEYDRLRQGPGPDDTVN